MAGQSLRDRTIKGVGWSFVGNAISYGITFIVGIVLARILTPDEYGLIGIVSVFITIFNGVVDSGFSSALIRKTEVNELDYNTAFYTNIAISLALYAVLFVIAPFIASLFKRLELISLTRVMGLGLLIQAFTLVQNTSLSRKLDFKTKTKASIISAIISGVLGIVMAATGYGAWALVVQYLSNQLLKSIYLWISNKWQPSFEFSKDSFKNMWNFGWKLSVSGILDSIANELSKFVIGKFYSPASLGQYNISSQTASIFSSGLTSVVQQVSYPALSKIQEDKPRMVAAYRNLIKTTMFVTTICLFTLGAIAEPFLFCIIGPKWSEAARYLPYLCVSMSLYPLHAINLNMLKVQGRSDLFLALEIIKKVVCIPEILVGIFVGIVPMLIIGIVISGLCFFLNAQWSGKYLGYSAWMQLKDVMPSFGIAAMIAIPVYFIKFFSFSYWHILAFQLLVSITIFIIICKAFRTEEFSEIKDFVHRFIYVRNG